MKNLLIGSRALNFWFPSVQIKDSTDWDVITNRAGAFQEAPNVNIEYHDPWLLNNEEFSRFTTEDATLDLGGQKVYIVQPRGLCIIKRSHLWRDLKFDNIFLTTIITLLSSPTGTHQKMNASYKNAQR